MEQWGILRYHADCFSYRIELGEVDVLVIDEDSTRGRAVEAVKETYDGGFSTARGSDESYFLAGRNGEGKITEDGSIGVIGKVNVIKPNRTTSEVKRFGIGYILFGTIRTMNSGRRE